MNSASFILISFVFLQYGINKLPDIILNHMVKKMNCKKIISVCLTISLLTGCSGKKSNPANVEAAIPVLTTKPSKIKSEKEISLSGNIEGNKTVRLGFLVAGKIDFIAANEGQLVSKGELLSSLDPTNYGIAKELADIQVSQVQDEYDRLKLMHDNNSLSESDFAKITYGLQQAKAQQKLHTKNQADTKLYSPITGVLLKKLCEVGEITGVGIPLFVVSDIRKIKVSAFIPENELHNIKLGQEGKVLVSSLSETFIGRIIEVGSAADPASRSFSVKIEVDNPKMLIRPGMIAEVKIITGEDKELMVIPVEAVLHDFNNQSFVYVVDESTNKGFKRTVSLGEAIDDKIEVISGLKETETIVSGGQQKLVDGSPVVITK
jgi:RND family efflux transporter MFP subunit